MHRVDKTMSKELLLFKPDSISQCPNCTAALKIRIKNNFGNRQYIIRFEGINFSISFPHLATRKGDSFSVEVGEEALERSVDHRVRKC